MASDQRTSTRSYRPKPARRSATSLGFWHPVPPDAAIVPDSQPSCNRARALGFLRDESAWQEPQSAARGPDERSWTEGPHMFLTKSGARARPGEVIASGFNPPIRQDEPLLEPTTGPRFQCKCNSVAPRTPEASPHPQLSPYAHEENTCSCRRATSSSAASDAVRGFGKTGVLLAGDTVGGPLREF